MKGFESVKVKVRGFISVEEIVFYANWHGVFTPTQYSLQRGQLKGKAIDFTSPRTSSGQASWPYETVPYGKILSPSEGGRKPQGENHQALAVKGERHPTCGLELNPGCSSERRTCYHGATKPQFTVDIVSGGSRGGNTGPVFRFTWPIYYGHCQWRIGGWGTGDVRLHLGPNSFIFMQFSANIFSK